MPNEQTDKRGFNTNEPDVERTVASQGGPATGLGDPSNRVAPSGSDVDSATTAAAASTSNNGVPSNNSERKDQTNRTTEDDSVDETESDGNMGMPPGK